MLFQLIALQSLVFPAMRRTIEKGPIESMTELRSRQARAAGIFLLFVVAMVAYEVSSWEV